MMKGDWGVPDWQEGDAYPDPASTPMLEWWWEFTRRRPDYRAAWVASEPVPGRDYRYAADVDEFRLRFELSLIHDPARRMTEWEALQWRCPRNFMRSPVEPLLDARVRSQVEDTLAETAKARAMAETAKAQAMAEAAGHTLYNFDISQPLRPQLERAALHLEAVQKEIHGKVIRRPRTGNWRDFLRVLDARDLNVSYSTVQERLWPGQEKSPQAARDTYEAARRLRDNFPL